ncbi:MAG: hypothetical protein BroJett022_24790 [Actinomycetes bacterium]|nr:MAG: hypothetical protein BroJett022_24790 [Actinomycetes bacterium]
MRAAWTPCLPRPKPQPILLAARERPGRRPRRLAALFGRGGSRVLGQNAPALARSGAGRPRRLPGRLTPPGGALSPRSIAAAVRCRYAALSTLASPLATLRFRPWATMKSTPGSFEEKAIS